MGSVDDVGRVPAASFLRLLQMSDSQFPVGAFAHSNGIETYAQEGLGPDGLEALLATQVELGWGRLDLAGWVRAYRAPDRTALDVVGRELTAWKPVEGIRTSSVKIGSRTARLVARLWPQWSDLTMLAHPHQAVVLGAVAARDGVPETMGVLAFAQATLAAQLAAATRCMPLSPERAQEIMVALAPLVVSAAERAVEDPEAHFWSATPAADLAAHRQARLTTRLFQS